MSVTELLFELLDSAGDEYTEQLTSFGCVFQWARRHGVEIAWPQERTGDVSALRSLRDGLIEGVLGEKRELARRRLASLARMHHLVPVLIGDPPVLAFRSDRDRVGDALAGVLVGEAMRLHTSGEVERIGGCEARRCGRLFVDSSPHRTRRFCSTACGTRDRVNRYRAARHWTTLRARSQDADGRDEWW